MKRRIAVTGLGAVTPIGIGVENFWNAAVSGKCGTGEITLLQMDGIVSKEKLIEALTIAKNSIGKVSEIQKNALKEKYSREITQE